MKKNFKKVNRKNYLTAKLTIYEWGWADKIIYRMKVKDTDKSKGLLMLDKLMSFFGISRKDMDDFKDKEVEEQSKVIKWTRDEEGKIVSPFRSKNQ